MGQAGNPYRGQIRLALHSGEVLAVIDANALRLCMEDLKEDDLTEMLTSLQTKGLDRVPRLLWHGLRNAKFLEGSSEPPMPWEFFAAQVGQLEFEPLVKKVAKAIELGTASAEKKSQASTD